MSAVWVFQQFATAIGRERELEYLRAFRYGSATFEHDVTNFWLNGDLQISPLEQVAFLRRMFSYELPVDRVHIDTVKADLTMPRGKIRERGRRARLRAALAGGHDRPRQDRQRHGERRARELAGRRARDRRASVPVREPRARRPPARSARRPAPISRCACSTRSIRRAAAAGRAVANARPGRALGAGQAGVRRLRAERESRTARTARSAAAARRLHARRRREARDEPAVRLRVPEPRGQLRRGGGEGDGRRSAQPAARPAARR